MISSFVDHLYCKSNIIVMQCKSWLFSCKFYLHFEITIIGVYLFLTIMYIFKLTSHSMVLKFNGDISFSHYNVLEEEKNDEGPYNNVLTYVRNQK